MRGPDHIESSPGHLPPQCRQTPRPTEKVTHLTLLTRFGMKPRTSRTRACTWTIQTQTTSWHLTSTMWEQRTTPVIFGKQVKNQKTQCNMIFWLFFNQMSCSPGFQWSSGAWQISCPPQIPHFSETSAHNPFQLVEIWHQLAPGLCRGWRWQDPQWPRWRGHQLSDETQQYFRRWGCKCWWFSI